MNIIEVKNIGKRYQIGERQRYLALRDTLMGIIRAPFAWIKSKAKPVLGESEDQNVFWALKDMSFNVKKGEVLGIIGRNGAGKSTLLKILSRVTPPTTGEIILRGRVSSLLEVGTGFHPELTGRENIYLNGVVLGMTKKEIDSKFKEIVEFSGIEKFLDTPVKRYSSGMQVRLGFAVAAHLEPEILIVDEVLAVGDLEFQKKCLGKMEQVTKEEGRTILFVSHNLGAITQLCKSAIVLDGGKIVFAGKTDEAVHFYSKLSATNKELSREWRPEKKALVKAFDVERIGESFSKYLFTIKAELKAPMPDMQVAVGINDELGNRITTLFSKWYQVELDARAGVNVFECVVDDLKLKPGIYGAQIFLGNNYEAFDYVQDPVRFEIQNFDFFPEGFFPADEFGHIVTPQKWSVKHI